MSDTPRTDQIEKLAYWFQDDMTPVCESRFVRSLERELNSAQDRIKQLEEAGDAILKAFSKDPDKMCFDDWVVMTTDTRTNWLKAKEAKP